MKEMFCLCALLAAAALPASGSIIIHFDDLSNQTANGLSHLGVTYNFTLGGISSTEAIYGVPFPADSLIGPSVLMGPTSDLAMPSDFGVLTISFDQPTSVFAFAIALSTTAADDFGLILTDDLGVSGMPVTISAAPDPLCDPNDTCLSEATYTYSGSEPISAARFDFSDTGAAQFAIGTLEYSESIPEPSSLLLSSAVALLLIAAARRRASGFSDGLSRALVRETNPKRSVIALSASVDKP